MVSTDSPSTQWHAHVNGNDGDDGAEDLVRDKSAGLALAVAVEAHEVDAHAVARDVGLAAVDELALLVGLLDDLGEALVVTRVADAGSEVERVANERARGARGIELVEAGVSGDQSSNLRSLHGVDELIDALLGAEDVVGGHADLASVQLLHGEHAARGNADVGVARDNNGALAAELERGRGERLRGSGSDNLADLAGAGVENCR